MSARENILSRIRQKTGKPGATTAAELDALRAHAALHARGPLPSFATDDPLTRFKSECVRLSTTSTEVASIDDVPFEIARYISANALAMHCVGWREFAALDWARVGITFDDRPANGDDLIGVTGCFCAIGETGTLLLLGSPTTPKATALLPETHICIVNKSRIVHTMEDAFALMRNEIGEPPRATFFVSGPSRTADIEQTIVIGAHGPYRVHIILVP